MFCVVPSGPVSETGSPAIGPAVSGFVTCPPMFPPGSNSTSSPVTGWPVGHGDGAAAAVIPSSDADGVGSIGQIRHDKRAIAVAHRRVSLRRGGVFRVTTRLTMGVLRSGDWRLPEMEPPMAASAFATSSCTRFMGLLAENPVAVL